MPPKNITIVSDEGNVVSNSVIGPYKEGSSVNVTCMSTGGKYFYATNDVANDMGPRGGHSKIQIEFQK